MNTRNLHTNADLLCNDYHWKEKGTKFERNTNQEEQEAQVNLFYALEADKMNDLERANMRLAKAPSKHVIG